MNLEKIEKRHDHRDERGRVRELSTTPRGDRSRLRRRQIRVRVSDGHTGVPPGVRGRTGVRA